jgi:ferredoxin
VRGGELRAGVPAAEAGRMAVNERLVVDPIACVGHGLCVDLFPEWIRYDDWGYPIIDSRPVPEHLLEHARRAVAMCPTLALKLRVEAAPR